MIRKIWVIGFLFFLMTKTQAQNVSTTQYTDSTDISFTLPKIKWKKGSIDSFPSINNAPFILLEDAPELPKVINSFLFDKSKIYSIKLLNSIDNIITASITPSKGFISIDETNKIPIKGPKYSVDNFFPSNSFKLNDEYCARNKYGRVLEIYPLQYNPVTLQLCIHQQINIRIYHTNVNLKSNNINSTKSCTSKIEGLDSDHYGSLLIIAPDSFKTTLKPFITWKNQKGISTYFVAADSIENSTTLKQIVNQYYNQYNILYLLLVGDHQQVPAASTSYGMSDNSYGYQDGNDSYSDLFVGRFPAENKLQLSYMISKSIEYEKGKEYDSETTHFLGIASDGDNIGDMNETDYQHIKNIEDELLTNSYTTNIISAYDSTNTSISGVINQGCGIICYAGHGNEYMIKTDSYNSDSITHLTNTVYHPFFMDVACLNGAFTNNTCFAESLMRTSHNKKSTGTVAILASTISQPWNPPMCGQDEMIKSITGSSSQGKSYTLGKICSAGFSEMINTYGTGGVETATTWNLFGDPSLYIWSSTPLPLNITSNDKYNIRCDSFLVSGDENALITLSSHSEILDTAIVINGKATLWGGTITNSDTLMLTAVKVGYCPFQKSLPLYSDGGAYYGMHNLAFADNNAIIENDETIQLLPSITNHGNTYGRNVKVEIIECDSCFKIKQCSIQVDSIAPDTTLILSGLSISTTTENADQTEGSLTFKITDEQGQENSVSKTLTIGAPIIKIDEIIVDNQPLINEQQLFQNDTIEIKVVVSNSGHAPAYDVVSTLNFESYCMSYLDNNETYFTLQSLQSDTLTYHIAVNPDISIGTITSVTLTVNSNKTNTVSFQLIAREIEEIILGDQSYSVSEFPFNNYYKSNKSQFLIKAEEITSTKAIDSIGFYINNFPISTAQSSFKNLSIRFQLTNIESVGLTYSNMDSSTVVASYSSYNLPLSTGWINIDISDFLITEGENLLIELVWGLNSYCTSYQNSFKVAAHSTAYCSSTFGYHDTEYPPPIRNAENYLPDLRLVPCIEEQKDVVVALRSNTQTDNINYDLKIGSKTSTSNLDGFVQLTLPYGNYFAQLYQDEILVLTDSMKITSETDTLFYSLNTSSATSVTAKKNTTISQYNNHVYIKLQKEKANLRLFDTKGALVWKQTIYNNKDLNLNNFQPGIYLLFIDKKERFKIINF